MTHKVRQRPPEVVRGEIAFGNILDMLENLLERVPALEAEQRHLLGAVTELCLTVGLLMGRVRALELELEQWEADEGGPQVAATQVATD